MMQEAQTQLLELLAYLWRHLESNGHVDIASPAQSICYNIGLTRMIVNLQVIVLDQLQPSSLSHVQLTLREYILEALVISIDITLLPIQVMPPNLQSMHDCV